MPPGAPCATHRAMVDSPAFSAEADDCGCKKIGAGGLIARSFRDLPVSLIRRNLRLASGLVLFAYITLHLVNHALGLVSLDTAEAGLRLAVAVWQSPPGTVLLYGAAAVHFVLALWAVYERRTFRLPPAELLRIALGFTLPILLIGHAATTRLAYELFGLPPDYTRIVANLWVSDSQGRQLGLLAPGWLHGCMGLHFAFNRRPFYHHMRFVLFAAALLLPVLSALGFVAMGRELAESPAAAAAAYEYFSPTYAAQRIALAQWRDGLLAAYFAIIAAAFAAPAVRHLVERSRRHLISISYPGRTVRVPRGWSVLEASRSFHLPHASMCGGRARCSTCRVRVIAGADACPPPQGDERRTLERIGAARDIRLACQLRPQGDVSVVPLVRTERRMFRQEAAHRPAEHEIVVLVCDLPRRAELAGHHLPQDFLYGVTRYVEAIGHAIRAAGGTISLAGTDSVQALFGLRSGARRGAEQALAAADAIKTVTTDLDERIGRRSRMRVTVSIHAGRAVVGEVDAVERPALMAVGDAIDLINEIRKAAAAQERMFAISQPVYAAAGVEPVSAEEITVRSATDSIVVFLSASPPRPPQRARRPGSERVRSTLQRIWG
jgi:adenylate cyclase